MSARTKLKGLRRTHVETQSSERSRVDVPLACSVRRNHAANLNRIPLGNIIVVGNYLYQHVLVVSLLLALSFDDESEDGDVFV